MQNYAVSTWAGDRLVGHEPLVAESITEVRAFVQGMIVRRQMFWDSRGADLVESWPCLGSIFRRRFCGAASADVGG
ncbi:hypothetical protein, partial [Brevundimonas sp. DC300-4]|uniref:hypothetical protein n=1 Tax=Brevundimonas sp. DC300-4 TaxID=2804594 RepID=UPI003CEC7A6E